MQTSQNYLTDGKLVIQVEQAALSRLAEKLDHHFSKACDLLLHTKGRLIVIGIGKSGHIGNKIAATFASTGTPAFFVHPAEAAHGDLGMITKQDMVLFISSSGSTPELIALIDPINHIGAQILAITGKPNSPIAKAAHVHLDASVDQEACPLGLAPTASTTAALVLGDALAIAILKARGFTAEQFGLIHPGGTLGRRLAVKLSDLMLTGDAIPTVPISASFSTASTVSSLVC
jgi:arabinose-5-phosphate isomerase